MFIGPFGSSLKNDCFVEEENGYCVVYEQKHAIEKRVDLPFRYVTQEKYQELRRFEVLPGDIIVSCRGTVGKVYRIPEGAPLGIMHPSIMKIRLKEESYQSEYFVFAVAEYMKERESKNLGTGVKMAVTAADMGKELFAKPSISAQIAFISIIHQADKSKFDGLKSQFIEMFGDTFQNERGWTYKKLPEVSTIVLGSTPSSSNAAFWDGDVKWITPAELSDDSFYLYDSERHITEEGVKSTSLKPFPAGTVILSTRAPIGKTAIAGCEMYCNQGFKNFVCDNTINPVYLFYSLRIHNPELQKMGTGSTFLELSKKAIEQISISVPPKELQDEFEQFYKQADKSKFELKQAIEKIDNVMRALMQ